MNIVTIFQCFAYLVALVVYLGFMSVWWPISLVYQLLTACKQAQEDHLDRMAQ